MCRLCCLFRLLCLFSGKLGNQTRFAIAEIAAEFAIDRNPNEPNVRPTLTTIATFRTKLHSESEECEEISE